MSWKTISGYFDYEISHIGKIRNKKSRKLLNGCYNQEGYLKVGLYNKDTRSFFYIHRLVALHFVDNPNYYVEVHHINSIRDDNRSCNVMWVTHAENIGYIYKPLRKNFIWKNNQYPKMI